MWVCFCRHNERSLIGVVEIGKPPAGFRGGVFAFEKARGWVYAGWVIIFPAIDIKEGRCVRLLQGRADAQTVYHRNPVAPAIEFAAEGAQWVHVVDLDGAFEGVPKNLDAVKQIVMTGLKVELGGGMRTEKAVDQAFEAGVSRAVIGTKACEHPEILKNLVNRYGSERIAVGIDAKDGKVALRGWVEDSGMDALELARRVADYGVGAIIYTDIATDGMLSGPNIAAQAAMLEAVPHCQVVASGGISCVEDLDKLNKLGDSHANLQGVIVGKAIYEKKVSLCEVLERFA